MVSELFACADFAVFPYRKISNSGSLFLSIEMKTPVIISNKGGVKELFKKYGDIGYLIEGNSKYELKSAIEVAFRNEAHFFSNIEKAK